MSFRKESSNADLTRTNSKSSDKDKSKKDKTTSSGTLSPRVSEIPSSFNLIIKQQILDIDKQKYPKAITQFLKFIKIFRDHGTATRDDILNDDEIVKKLSKDIIANFFKKKKLRENLAEEFINQEVIDSDLKYFHTILLNAKIQESLKKEKAGELTEADVSALCESIKTSLKKPEKQQEKQAEKPVLTKASSLKKSKSIAEVEVHSDAEKKPNKTLATIIEIPSLKKLFVYSNESVTADKEINVRLMAVKKHLEDLKVKMEADQSNTLNRDVYFAADNLYSTCHNKIKEQQRDTKDNHRPILKSNEARLLKELDNVLTSVYAKPFDYSSASPEQLGKHILDKRKALEDYNYKCRQIRLPASLGKIAAAVGIAIGITLACILVGAFIGAVAFAWTGPFTFLAAAKGAFIGGNLGWSLGVLAAATITGVSVTAAMSKFWLFKEENAMKQRVDVAKSELGKVVDAAELLKRAP